MASVKATTQTVTTTGNQGELVRPGEENARQLAVTPPLPEYNQDFIIEIPAPIFNLADVTTYSRPCSPEVSPAFLPMDGV